MLANYLRCPSKEQSVPSRSSSVIAAHEAVWSRVAVMPPTVSHGLLPQWLGLAVVWALRWLSVSAVLLFEDCSEHLSWRLSYLLKMCSLLWAGAPQLSNGSIPFVTRSHRFAVEEQCCRLLDYSYGFFPVNHWDHCSPFLTFAKTLWAAYSNVAAEWFLDSFLFECNQVFGWDRESPYWVH